MAGQDCFIGVGPQHRGYKQKNKHSDRDQHPYQPFPHHFKDDNNLAGFNGNEGGNRSRYRSRF
jgi:hypothetical protein